MWLLRKQYVCSQASKATLLLILIEVFASLDIVRARDCIINPYITSIRDVEMKANETIIDFTLALELDYRYSVIIKDIYIFEFNKTIGTINSKIQVSRLQGNDIVFRQDKASSSGNFRSFRHTKQDYLDSLTKRFRLLNLERQSERAIDLAPACSPTYIYTADYIVSDIKGSFTHVLYHKSLRCIATHDVNGNLGDYKPFKSSGPWTITNVVSASYSNSFLFEFTANGFFYLKKFREGQRPSMSSPLGGIFELVMSSYLAPLPSVIQVQRPPILNELFCSEIIMNLQVDQSTIDDMMRIYPLRTVARIERNTFIAVESHSFTNARELPLKWYRANPDGPYKQEIGPPIPGLESFSNYSIDSLSFVDYPSGTNMLAILIGKFTYETLYLVMDLHERRPNVFRVQEIVAPDDITHWTTCERVVSIYGYLYTLHEYGQNILEERGKWEILDTSRIDFPIEAMHAEGDEFWFFTKTLTVVKMMASSQKCDHLEFSSKDVVHMEQFFNNLPRQFVVEGRYFDGSVWVPQWSELQKEPNEMLFYWYYVIGGVALFGTILTTMAVVSFRSTKVEAGDVIYSRSRASERGHKLEQEPNGHERQQDREPATASNMPLMSMHNSAGSQGSSESRSGRSGEGARRKKKRSPVTTKTSPPIRKKRRPKSPAPNLITKIKTPTKRSPPVAPRKSLQH